MIDAPHGKPPVVQGIALDAHGRGVDAVPLIDASTAGVLAAVNSFTVVQRPMVTEMLGCERSNIYDIFDAATGVHIFLAKERSECCSRQFCAPRHSFFVDFKLATPFPNGQAFHVDIDAHVDVHVDVDTDVLVICGPVILSAL